MADYTFWNGSDFWIGDHPLNYIDDNGCKWMVHDVDGWWELPPPEIPEDSRPYSDDGDYYTAGRYAPRIITITGRIIPPTTAGRAAVTDARDRLNSTLNSARKAFVFRVDEPGYSKQANVQISSKPDMTINDYKNHVEFTIQMKASDPRKYSSILHNIANTLNPSSQYGRQYPRAMYYTFGNTNSDNVLHARNDGNYHTYGTIRISGPVRNPRLYHVEQDKFLQINDTIATGSFVDINLRTRTIKVNGKQFKRSSLSTDSSWFTLSPGENSIRFTGTQHIAAVEGRQAAKNLALNPSWEYAVTSTSNVLTTNLITTPSPSSSVNMKLSSSNNGTMTGLSRVVDTPLGQNATVNQVTVNITDSSQDFRINVHSTAIPVESSKKYAYSVYIKSSMDLDIQPALFWSSATSVAETGGVTRIKADEWTRVSMVGSSGPSDTTVIPALLVLKGQMADKISLYGAMLEKSPYVSEYFDGSFTGRPRKYRWSGSAFNSPSQEYGDSFRVPSSTKYGATTTPFNAVTWRQLRNSVDDTDNTGNVAGVKPKTLGEGDNLSFVVPSSEPGGDSGIIEAMSQGLESGKTYTALVEVIVPEAMKGTYTETQSSNLATNPSPMEAFSSNWSSLGFSDPLTYVSSETANGDHVRVLLSSDDTQISGSGIVYSQDRGEVPTSQAVILSGMVRSNREFPIQPVVRWYNGTSLVRESFGELVYTNTEQQWVNAEVVATAPQVFTKLTLSFYVTNINQTSTWSPYDFFDAKSILIMEGDVSTGFFDGSTPNTDTEIHTWDGAVGRSTSTRIERTGGEDSLHEYARSLVFFTMSGPSIAEINPDSVVMDTAPNAPGEYQLRIEFTTPEDSFFTPMFVSLWNGSPSPSDIIYFDKFLIVEGTYEGNYFDGSMQYASWDGTTNLSTSTQQEVTEIPEAEALIQYRSAWIS